jgi:hypothetical protein
MRTSKRERKPSADVDDDTWVKCLKQVRDDAAKALNSLVRKGCDRPFIIECMRVLSLAHATRLSRVSVLRAVKALRKAQDWVKRVEASDVRSVIARHPEIGELAWELEEYADSVEAVAPLADGRRALEYDDCLAALVRHVESVLGRPDDERVSLLVAASPDVRTAANKAVVGQLTPEERLRRSGSQPSKARTRADYGSDAHAHWRDRHRTILGQETRFERAWRAKQERAASGWAKLAANLKAAGSTAKPGVYFEVSYLKET